MTASFAVITPVLNGMPRIKAAAASVALQRSGRVSVRHVVQLSEASSDGTREWLASFPDANARVSRDSGMYDAVSRGFSDASEDFLCWLNADEQYLPGALETAASVFERNPDAGIVFGDYVILDGNSAPIAARREIPARLWYLRHGVNYIFSCAAFMRRGVWRKLGGFDLSLRYLADKEFYMRAISSGIKTVHVPRYLGAFGATGENLSLSADAVEEQKLLRGRTGAYGSRAARILPRLCRCAEKAARGSYFPKRVVTSIIGNDGSAFAFDAKLPTFWRWK